MAPVVLNFEMPALSARRPFFRRNIAMTRTGFLIIATAALTGAIPGVAHASCSGSACSAVSAAATWSASDKRVNAVLTNRDQAKELRLKFCINVDGRCENYELTLPPHGTVTKTLNMSMRLGAAPKV